MSALTPPVAVTAIRSAIANANPLEIAVNAVDFGWCVHRAVCILFNNALLLDGKPAGLSSHSYTLFGIGCLAIAVRAISSALKPWVALILAVSGLLMLVPVWQIVCTQPALPV